MALTDTSGHEGRNCMRHEIARIRGVTLLGELHHMLPDFESGMGFDPPYLVSDYSESSKRSFRAFLKSKYGSNDRLNQVLGTRWTSSDQVDPPSKDIRTTPLRNFTEHIDSFAQGSLPITGWVDVKPGKNPTQRVVRIYRNGELIGRAPVNLGRQDVLQAPPEVGDANTGGASTWTSGHCPRACTASMSTWRTVRAP